MKILVVGSRGFIGSRLTSYLREINHHVTECDVHTEYGDDDYIQVSVVDTDFDDVFAFREYDVCINCSGAASVSDSFKNESRDFQLNVSNVQKMLYSLMEHQTQCKFVNLSSAAVYGNPESLPLNETMLPNPISPYGYHKCLSELILNQFSDLHKIQTVSLRIFSAFGEGLKKQILWDLYHKMKTSDKVELFGTGKETRDFIHIQDLVAAISLVLELEVFEDDIVNIASGEETSIRDLATRFGSALDWKGTISFSNNERSGDPDNWRADVTRLTRLGFTPKATLDSGLKMYAAWVSERY